SATVQRMACDCSVTRVLLDQDSAVVDMGRSKRVVSSALRSALKIRDGHCQWPGCEREASRCDGHHLVHWISGGETNLANLVLLCATCTIARCMRAAGSYSVRKSSELSWSRPRSGSESRGVWTS